MAIMLTLDDYVPEAIFHKDHWSTLAYMQTVIVDYAGFQVGLDPHMRQGRRNYRVMRDECPRPIRPGSGFPISMVHVMDNKYSTKMRDGSVVDGHDDWHCVQDMANAGYFTYKKRTKFYPAAARDVEPGVVLNFSEKGFAVVNALLEHKAKGGNFAGFKWGA